MKHNADIGLEYVRSLDLNPVKTFSKLESVLNEKCGDAFTFQILEHMNQRSADNCSDDLSCYYLKNTDRRSSLTISGAVDGDIIRKACNWIAEHPSMFGQKILEIGCDCGIISCFLAKTFPHAAITAIDRCEKAVILARQLADKMRLTNIDFQVADAKNLSVECDTYDTVFSLRTAHENLIPPDEDHSLLIKTQGTMFQNALETYANVLFPLVKSSGTLISIERCGRDPLYLGWLHALNKAGLIPASDYYNELICRELEDENVSFQITIAMPGKPLPAEEIHAFFSDTFSGHIRLEDDVTQWTDWEAAILLQNSVKDLIEGYFISTKSGEKYAKLAIWSNVFDEESILIEQYLEGNRILSNCHIDTLSQCKESLKAAVLNEIKHGAVAKPFVYADGNKKETDTLLQ